MTATFGPWTLEQDGPLAALTIFKPPLMSSRTEAVAAAAPTSAAMRAVRPPRSASSASPAAAAAGAPTGTQ